MNNLDLTIKKAEEAGYGLLMITCGMSNPPYTETLEFADMAIKAGVDILACPVMISDVHVPWMMGGTEQIMDVQNAKAGIGPNICWGSIDAIRAKYPDVAISAGSFPSDIIAYGAERFAKECEEHGVVALDCPGLSYILNDESTATGRAHKALEEHGIAMIQQVSTDMALAEEGTKEYDMLMNVLNASYGLILLMADAGGKSGAIGHMDVERLKPAAARVRSKLNEMGRNIPIITVCGVSTPENGDECVHQSKTDGAMISSCIIRRMQAGETLEQIGDFLHSMKMSFRKY